MVKYYVSLWIILVVWCFLWEFILYRFSDWDGAVKHIIEYEIKFTWLHNLDIIIKMYPDTFSLQKVGFRSERFNRTYYS